ncbi:hypothetical protein Ahy_A04g021007 [Arachis hypogaea]|uniref:Uncharacterized protein n=1 Tax=Arachis hypogaea TaxID=3818 RepID=A0A445DJ82_ARAHY|nr:hypothetical protein Ahy_A04g021007 [Arachis hypogaea]
MAYFTVVSNHGSYRVTSHEFKLVFLHRTTVVAVDEDVIPKTCFNLFLFSDLLNMTKDYNFLVVGEEKEYAKEEKIVKMIVLELTSKDMIEQGVKGTQPLFIANEGKVVSLKDDFMRLTRDVLLKSSKITMRRVCDDSTIIAMFKLPDYDTDDESTPKKPDVSGGIEVAALINDENEKVEKTPKNDILSDDFSFELDILLSSPVKETQEVFSQVLNACSHYGEKVIHKDHVVTSKGKKNLNPQFDEAANDANGRGSNIAKVDGV